jgi:type IV secretion system protein VirB4
MFAVGGDYEGLFDAATDALTTNPVQTFEMNQLLHRPSILAPVLRYVLNLHVEPQMSTAAPMFLAMDDAAVSWMADSMGDATQMDGMKRQEKVKTYLQTARKKSVSLGFSTHTLVEVLGGAFGTILQEACPTRFCLPNGSALEGAASHDGIYRVYRQLGFTDAAIQMIAHAQPQRDVYYSVRELGQQLVSLPLPKTVLDCLARNSAADHALIDRLLAQEGPEGFAPAWLRACGQEEAATFVERYHDDTQSVAPVTRAGA